MENEKGQSIAIRYQPVKMFRIEGKIKTPVSSVERLSAEANLYRKFKRISYRNYMTLSGQRNKYSLGANAMVNNTSLTVSSFQNLLIRKNSLYINTNYNHTNNSSQYAFLNSSFIQKRDIPTSFLNVLPLHRVLFITAPMVGTGRRVCVKPFQDNLAKKSA